MTLYCKDGVQLLSASPNKTPLPLYQSKFIPQLSTSPLDLAAYPQREPHSVVSAPVSDLHFLFISLFRLDGKSTICFSRVTVLQALICYFQVINAKSK